MKDDNIKLLVWLSLVVFAAWMSTRAPEGWAWKLVVFIGVYSLARFLLRVFLALAITLFEATKPKDKK